MVNWWFWIVFWLTVVHWRLLAHVLLFFLPTPEQVPRVLASTPDTTWSVDVRVRYIQLCAWNAMKQPVLEEPTMRDPLAFMEDSMPQWDNKKFVFHIIPCNPIYKYAVCIFQISAKKYVVLNDEII